MIISNCNYASSGCTEGRVVYVRQYFVINSYFQKLTGEFCLVILTSDEITTGLGKDKGSVPDCRSSTAPEGKMLPFLLLCPHLQSRNDDKGLFYKAFFELENTATVVQAQTMVPVLKKMERGQILGCLTRAELL